MLRSMYSGVSGLKVHQVKLDVVGNNIANVNTTGYKSSRVTFKEMLTQTLRGSSRPSAGRGGLNPMEIGLGVGLGSIDTDLSQGNLQATGNMTDIAIQGNGFFVVSDGAKNYFSRAGSFTFDLDGNLVHSTTGFRVMGWMADKQGVMDVNPSTMTPLSLGELNMTPKASTFIEYTGNLDSNKDIFDLKYEPERMTITDLNGNSAQLYISLEKSNGENTADRVDDQWEWRAYTEVPVEDISVTLTGANPIPLPTADGDAGFDEIVSGSVVVKNTADGTAYVEGKDYIIDYETGTIERLAGGAIVDGENVDVKYIYKTEKESGTITVDETGKVSSCSPDTFSISMWDSSGNEASQIEVQTPLDGQAFGGSFKVITDGVNARTIDGSYGPMKMTSYTVYDSKGNAHTVNLSFIKTDTNRWDWFAEGPVDPNGDPYSLVGNYGTIMFDASGKIIGTPTGGPIVFQPVDAERMVLTPDFSALTQFASADSIRASNADGFEAGSLQSFDIDATGTIVGIYSNGLNQPIAKLSIATFANAAGLNRAGDTIFTDSNNSGTPEYDLPGIAGRGLISPGTLEMSNVDLADQFTEMITAQRGFQASSKIISTADQILQDLVNLKR